jgi:hypothetical protein
LRYIPLASLTRFLNCGGMALFCVLSVRRVYVRATMYADKRLRQAKNIQTVKAYTVFQRGPASMSTTSDEVHKDVGAYTSTRA